jgi:DNA/RNA endonuclease YhcR with UshA esterase domain
MKVSELVLLLTLVAVPASGEPIRAGDAIVHLGETTTVEGRVSIDMMRSGEIYIDLDGSGSKSSFSGYISRWNAARFVGIDHLSGRNIDITGPIATFRGRPEIVIMSPSQITVK